MSLSWAQLNQGASNSIAASAVCVIRWQLGRVGGTIWPCVRPLFNIPSEAVGIIYAARELAANFLFQRPGRQIEAKMKGVNGKVCMQVRRCKQGRRTGGGEWVSQRFPCGNRELRFFILGYAREFAIKRLRCLDAARVLQIYFSGNSTWLNMQSAFLHLFFAGLCCHYDRKWSALWGQKSDFAHLVMFFYDRSWFLFHLFSYWLFLVSNNCFKKIPLSQIHIVILLTGSLATLIKRCSS